MITFWRTITRSGFFIFAIALAATSACASETTIIGAIEDIIIMPSGVKIPARIDTGAASSSLDVSHYKIKGKEVFFRLADRCGGHTMRSRLISMKTIRTSDGKTRRPVVAIDICIGSEIIRTNVTLNNRAKMDYPFLIGRQTLQGRYIVDVSRKNILPPVCRQDATTVSESVE